MRIIDCSGSTHVLSAVYDENTCVLEIEFKGGAVYCYQNVPEYLIDAFDAAESKGSFGHKYIYKQFPGTRIR